MAELKLAGQPKADALISKDAFALLIGMVLDQQIPLEKAFAGPAELKRRLGNKLSVKLIAGYDPEELTTIFCTVPALHRFPAANCQRVIKLAHIIEDEYNGKAETVWTHAANGKDLLNRIKALPGFGEQKAKIFVALLGKQLEIQPKGWKEACAPFGNKGTSMSIADINDEQSLTKVRAWKKAKKEAAKSMLVVEPTK